MGEEKEKLMIMGDYMQILPSYQKMDKRGLTLYLSFLDDIPAERLARAFKFLATKISKFPTPAEVLEAAEYVMTDEEKEARSAEIKAKQDAWLAAHYERDFGEPYKP